MTTIWIDVEDLFDYAVVNPRPSGIQRVEYEVCRSLAASEAGDRIRFVRHAPGGMDFRTVEWAEVEALFAGFSKTTPQTPEEAAAKPMPASGTLAASVADLPPPRRRLRRRVLSWFARRTPTPLRLPLGDAVIQQIGAIRSVARAGRIAWSAITLRKAPAGPASSSPAGHSLREAGADEKLPPRVEAHTISFDTALEGDVLLVLGSPWFHREYGALARRMREERGLRFGVLLYDIIPLRRPEFCDQGLVRIFGHWLSTVLPHADVVMAISRASAEDIDAYGREKGWKLRAKPVAIPMGTGFGTPAPAVRLPGRDYPEAGSYALIVSTIEARKNHILLFRIWRRMLEEMPREKVPTLVFAGRVGWMVADLMQQIRNADHLDGKLVVFQDPTDGELTTLYQGAQFTLFPSFYEGWGLPVTESLAFGKPPIISNTTSLPEAGGTLALYFDPENTSGAYEVVKKVVEDPEGLRRWQARVAREFQPVPWDAAASAVLAALDGTGPPA